MSENIKICPRCGKISYKDINCMFCGCDLIITDVDSQQLRESISMKLTMTEKKIKNQLYNKYCFSSNEYNVNMFEKREEDEASYKSTSYSLKCPLCGSTSLSKISTVKKVAKVATFGIFGLGDNGKTWKCNVCGSKF
ncbi:MAG: hypothetical protein KH031_10095 [Clostridiales bacterium]|nr:hypothetical protein [Clostridiales bacterium]